MKQRRDFGPIKMLVTQQAIQFLPEEKLTGIKHRITLDRHSNDLNLNSHQFDHEGAKTTATFGFLGLLKIYGKLHLFYITEAELMAQIDSHAIYRVRNIQSIRVNYVSSPNNEIPQYQYQIESIDHMSKLELDMVQHIEKYLGTSTYFSFTYDLTLPIHSSANVQRSHHFWWNFNMLKPFFSQNVATEWCIRLVQGYVGSFNVKLKSTQTMQYTLITRREWLRGGTRYNHRGIDEEGAAANFVETEQIIILGDNVSAHIQVRGSVPIYWQQSGIRANAELTKDFESTKSGFERHFQYLKRLYGKVLCVNLMSNDKSAEQLITKCFETHIQLQKIQDVVYKYIDFHKLCKNYNFEKLNDEITQSDDILKQFGFYNNQKKLLQQGVVRTNCLDCLDRTNVFMTKIAFKVIHYILSSMDINIIDEFNCQSLLWMETNKQPSVFLNHLKQLWADNGDAISKAYVGTNATTTKITKQGGGGWTGMFEHGIKGIERFYRQNFEDNYKQDIYDIIISKGQNLSEEKSKIMDKLASQILKEKEQKNTINILVVSVNLMGQVVNPVQLNMTKLFEIKGYYQTFNTIFFKKIRKIPPDLIFVCFQRLNLQYGSLYSMPSFPYMQSMLVDAIKGKLSQYEMISNNKSENQYAFIFARQAVQEFIEKEENKIVSIDESRSKKALVFKLIYKGFIMNFVSIILPNELVKQMKALEKVKQGLSADSDLIVICGDLNSSLSLCVGEFDAIMREYTTEDIKLNRQIIKTLTQRDKLLEYMLKHEFYKNFQETNPGAPISLKLPKKEVIQWKNRIIYGSQKCIQAIRNVQADLVNGFGNQKQLLDPIRMQIQLDKNLQEQMQQEIQQEADDKEQMMYSTKFYSSGGSLENLVMMQNVNESDFEIVDIQKQ